MNNDSLALIINGEAYLGWESIQVKRSMETACGSFSLTVSDRWQQKGQVFPIHEQDEVQIKIGEDLILTGFVDCVEPSINSSRREVRVEGRDKTCDIIDCSNYLKKVTYNKTDFLALANIFIEPFGLNIAINTDLSGNKGSFSIEPGETVFQTLQRLAEREGAMIGSDEFGNLTVYNKGSERAAVALQLGVNIKEASAKYDFNSRFSKYIVRGQSAGDGSESWGNGKNEVEAISEDFGCARYRPLLIHGDSNLTSNLAKRRAFYENTIRRARSLSCDVAVQGWRQLAGGPLWKINQLISITIPEFDLNSTDLLIGEVDFIKNESGTETRLHLVPEESYLLEPKKAKTPGGKGKSKWL